jgi:hypothetical protein
MKKITSLLFIALLLSNCATTKLYHNGQIVASFQGDMKAVEFSSSKDGMTLKAASIDHSAATLAQGKAASEKITAIGAGLAISGIPGLFKK